MAKRVLAVDDMKTMRDMLSFTLRGAGFDVVLAEDGVHALEMSGSAPVDLVITDVNMPRLDGISLVARLRAQPGFKSTPILILTTESDLAMKERAREAGATGWIVKPFTPDRLLAVIAKVCS